MITKLSDYGGHRARAPFDEVAPTSLKQVQRIVRMSYARGIPIRIRGNGHSMNGSTLPRPKELLVRTEKLNFFEVLSNNTVRVGAGATIWDLNQRLIQHGYKLKICNAGAAVGTVGGYLCAGGVADDLSNAVYGGFWATVNEITLVIHDGNVVVLRRKDPLFRWLFGSMGQLGFIVEVKLSLLKLRQGVRRRLIRGKIARSAGFTGKKFHWFTLFCPKEKAVLALRKLSALAARHEREWDVSTFYELPFKFHEFNPPLLYPKQKPFVGVGMWGTPVKGNALARKTLEKLETEFQAICASDSSFRRYIQTEWMPERPNYAAYFGKKIYAELTRLKKRVDPLHLINQEVL